MNTPTKDSESIPKRDRKGRFLPGNSAGGRPKGARSKLSEQFLLDMHNAWLENGRDAIDQVIKKRPWDFLKVIANLLPRSLSLSVTQYDDMSTEELLARMRQLDVRLRPLFDKETK